MKEPRHETREREARVLRLRAQGLSFAGIAQHVGLSSASTAHRVYRRAMDATVSEAAAELRQLEGARLDALQSHWWPLAMDGHDYRAAHVVIKITGRRAKLFGLDAPQRVQVNTPELDQQIEALIAELTETAAQLEGAPPPALLPQLDDLNDPARAVEALDAPERREL